MRAALHGALAVGAVLLSLWFTLTLLLTHYERLGLANAPPPQPAQHPPHLRGWAGDGEATLTWISSSQELARTAAWEYEVAEDNVRRLHGTGSDQTSHVVRGLANRTTYKYRVRAILKQGGTGDWSNAVSVTPMPAVNPIEKIERHLQSMAAQQEHMARRQAEMSREQGRIADATSEIAFLAAHRGESIRRLADNGVRALETLASSSVSMNEELAGMRGAITAVSGSVTAAGERIGSGLSGIREQLARLPTRTAAAARYCGGRGKRLGELYFCHDSFDVGRHEGNAARMSEVIEQVGEFDGGLILTVGHATAVGVEGYNMHLSDQRAACVARCIQEGLGDWAGFEFREVAMGEALLTRDLAGTSDSSRRVEVIACPDVQYEPGRYPDDLTDEEAKQCGCPDLRAAESNATECELGQTVSADTP